MLFGILEALGTVKDPEIPSVSIVEMGMVARVEEQQGSVLVDLIPTFVGCPALEIIRLRARAAVASRLGLAQEDVVVRFQATPVWTSDRILPSCHSALCGLGIAPPPPSPSPGLGEAAVACPWCGSQDTVVENLFGPTACRAICYCNACRNPFEVLKPV